jgi:hypothetical protein
MPRLPLEPTDDPPDPPVPLVVDESLHASEVTAIALMQTRKKKYLVMGKRANRRENNKGSRRSWARDQSRRRVRHLCLTRSTRRRTH